MYVEYHERVWTYVIGGGLTWGARRGDRHGVQAEGNGLGNQEGGMNVGFMEGR